MSALVANTPLWVWPLLAILIALGLRAARPRETSLLPYLFLPFIGAITLNTLAHLPVPSLVWGAWVGAYALGTAGGYALQRRWLIARVGWRVQLRGEWLTLVVVLTIFCANFFTGMMRAVAPDALASTTFLTVFPGIVGLCAGSFLGRSLRLFRTPARTAAA